MNNKIENNIDIEKKRKADREYYHRHKEKIRERDRLNYQKNRDRILERKSRWRESNREKLRKYDVALKTKKFNENISYRITMNLRRRLNHALKGKAKSEKTHHLLGCSIEEMRSHIQSQFKEGMNWGNYGHKGWHIDHIKPCSSFDMTDPEQQKQCFHYTNLQPLWWYDNLAKGDRL